MSKVKEFIKQSEDISLHLKMRAFEEELYELEKLGAKQKDLIKFLNVNGIKINQPVFSKFYKRMKK